MFVFWVFFLLNVICSNYNSSPLFDMLYWLIKKSLINLRQPLDRRFFYKFITAVVKFSLCKSLCNNRFTSCMFLTNGDLSPLWQCAVSGCGPSVYTYAVGLQGVQGEVESLPRVDTQGRQQLKYLHLHHQVLVLQSCTESKQEIVEYSPSKFHWR